MAQNAAEKQNGFCEGQSYPGLKIYLDGVEVCHVVQVHTGEGWIERFRTDPDGNVLVSGEDVQRERLFGNVTVVKLG